MNQAPIQQPLLTTLGTAVIDELRFSSGTISRDVLGGSGVHFAIGARLLLPHPSSRSICGQFHVGIDFTTSAEHLLLSWKSDLKVEWHVNKHTASNVLTFRDTTMGAQCRNYVHPSMFTQQTDLPARALTARVFHLTGPPSELAAQVFAIKTLRCDLLPPPIILWEPWPKACTPENLQLLLQALKVIDLFSPNHLELMSLFGYGPKPFTKGLIETLATQCSDTSMPSRNRPVVVVRCGEHGSLVVAPCICDFEGSSGSGERPVSKLWLPPFHADGKKVVCTTGAGNAFLGGLAVGWVETGDWFKACCYGNVAAGFLVEQIGLLIRTGIGEFELWNGEHVRARLGAFFQRNESELGSITGAMDRSGPRAYH